MATPPLFLGSKFKVLSLVGLSGSGIIGSFSAIHKSADRASETIDPAKAAIRKGLGYMFSGASQMGSQADEWLGYMGSIRFRALAFITRNLPRISEGQKSMASQGMSWATSAHDFLRDNLRKWLEMLPWLFYYFNRTRNTLFGGGLDEVELQNELIQKILEGDADVAKEVADLLLSNPTFQKTMQKVTELVKNFSEDMQGLMEGDDKEKAKKAQEEIFTGFGDSIAKAIGAFTGEGQESQQPQEAIKGLVDSTKVVDEKFTSNGLSDDKAKKAQKSTKELLDWMVSNVFLPLFTLSCDSQDGSDDASCTSVQVFDEEEEDQ